MRRVNLSYRGGDATQSRNGQAREGDQAEGDTEAQAATVRDTVVISHAAWGYRPTPVEVSLDDLVEPMEPHEEALFRLVDAVMSLITGDDLPLLTPGDLLLAPVPPESAPSHSEVPGIGMVYHRYAAYRPTEEHTLYIPTIVRDPEGQGGPTVVEVRLCGDLLRSLGMTPADVQWDVEYGLSLDVPSGGWSHGAAHVQIRLDVDGSEDQVELLLDPAARPPGSRATAPTTQPLESAGPHEAARAAGARRLRIWLALDEQPPRLMALGVQGFGAVFLGALESR